MMGRYIVMPLATNARPAAHSPARSTTPAWLGHLRVVRAGSSLPLLVAGRVLAQFGATVVPVDDPIDVNSSTEAWSGADVVLVDRIEGARDLPGLPAGDARTYLDFVRARNRSVWVTATAYGLTTGRADAIGSDLTVLSSAGILGHSRIGDEWPPTIPAGSIGLTLVGDVIALAALHGVRARLDGSGPIHVDVSAQAAVVATGLALEMAHALLDCPDEGGSARYGAPTGFFRCLDGAVYVVVLEQHQWKGFQASLAPSLDSVASVEEARRRAHFVNEGMAAWASTRTAEECERVLQEAGVACTAVNAIEDLAARSREAGRPMDLAGPDIPPMPAQVTEADKPDAAAAESPARLPLHRLRVLDAGHVLAVPLATAWLGAMGAVVTKLEDPQRLDVYRRRGPFAKGVAGLNRSAYFNAINFSKQPLDASVTASGSSLELGEFDVVVHNLSPRRAVQVGVDGPTVLAADGPKLAVSSSGFGSTGDWANYRAYGHNIHAFAGLVAATQNARGEMADVGTPWCDPLTSVAIATWICAWSLAPARDQGVMVDMSMSELMASQLADLSGIDPDATYRPRDGEREFFFRLGRSQRLVAVTLRGPDEEARFEWETGCRLDVPSRRGELVALDLGSMVDWDDVQVEEHLLRAGFAASVVRTAPELARDAFLRGTGLFQPVDSADLGRYDVTGLPWRFVGSERAPLWAAPERAGAPMTVTDTAQLVTYDRKADGIAHITLRRDRALNAINPAMMRALGEALEQFDEDESASVAVLAGAGRAFCAGADVKEMPPLVGPVEPGADLRKLPDLLLTRDRYKPIIAAAHGHVVGAGLRLVLLADFALCAESTRFRVAELHHGLDGGPYWWLLQARAGDAFAMDVVGTGRTWSGSEAAARGVVMRATSDDTLLSEARALAVLLSGQPRAALAALVEARRTALRALELTAWTTRGRGLGWARPAAPEAGGQR
jgi:crotonobetainyl-CoA:carnitine CoA-transferase CaiB-like acyl-CoA transferase/enoyl-CoA hydratase/carnithine racemase